MVIAPFTLAVAPAKANYDAVRIQADLQNAKGGINGHKVVVIGCDDQSDPNVGAKSRSRRSPRTQSQSSGSSLWSPTASGRFWTAQAFL